MTFKTSQQRIYKKFCDVIENRRGGMKADLALNVYALLMRDVLPSSANYTENEDDSPQDQSDFKYEATIKRTSSQELGVKPRINDVVNCMTPF